MCDPYWLIYASSSILGDDKEQLDYRLYDTVLSSDVTSSVDPEMEKFLPLLQEYLTSV